MTINFSLLAMDQIVNHAAHIHYMFGGQVKVPLVVRMPQGAGHQLGPTHSHSLRGAVPARARAARRRARRPPADAKGLLKTAIRDDNPVDLHRARVPLRPARRGARRRGPPRRLRPGAPSRREGADVTIVGISRMALTAERAAETLAERARASRPR